MPRFTGAFPRLARLVEAPARPGSGDPTPRRLRFAFRLFIVLGTAFAVHYELIGVRPMAVALAGAVAVTVVLSRCLRAGSYDAHWVGEWGLALLFVVVCVSNVYSGGIRDPNLAWFYVLPVGAASVLGPRVAVRWTLASVTAVAAFWAWETFGPGLVPRVPAQWRTIQALANPVAAMGVIGALVVAFVRSHVRALAQADAANSELVAERARLQVVACFDALTALPNRYAFDQALGARLAAGPVTLLYVDVDRFKDINDAYGHAVGDALLARVGRRLKRVVGEDATSRASASDDASGPMLARWGGDEFAILLSGDDPAVASALGQRIVRASAMPVAVRGHRLHVGASLGIAFGARGSSADELVRNADIALYRVKQRGGGGVDLFETRALESVQRRVLVETSLRTALPQNELRLVMQPLEDTTGALVGAEALLRWQSPTLGDVSPGEFIAIAERSGQMPEIGAWVLEQACLAASGWPEHLRVSVNVSVAQLMHGDIGEVVERALRRTRLHPSRVELEITESLMADDPHLVQTLGELAALGVSLALDDFGTGYSSLSTLRTLPVERVKIDRSFVRSLHERDPDLAMVQAIIGMAHALGLVVLAEGVEEQAQLETLAHLGCDEVQGYLLGRPLELADMARRAKRSRLESGPVEVERRVRRVSMG